MSEKTPSSLHLRYLIHLSATSGNRSFLWDCSGVRSSQQGHHESIKIQCYVQDKQSVWCGEVSEILHMTLIFLTWKMKKMVKTLTKMGSRGEGFWVKMIEFSFDYDEPEVPVDNSDWILK